MQENKKFAPVTPLVLETKDDQTVVLEAAGLTGVCTNQYLTVLKAFGDTSIYLKNENFNFDLSELLPTEIAMIIKAVAYKVLKSNQKITLTDLNFDVNGLNQLVNIVISPFSSVGHENQQLLILFSTSKSNPKSKSIIGSGDLRQVRMEYLSSLEQELIEVKNNLEAAYELVSSSNQNIQSFNEELQSANEEMQSSNEELQSVNEELQTVNKEQQQTNIDLLESNDDLNNYFRSNTNGQLFVDSHLLLKRYSPSAVKHINLQESDIGRPLADITTNIKFETLIADVQQVMQNGQIIIREAESSDGKVYQVTTMPFLRQNTGKTDGAIISFYEITELKKLLAALDISNKSLTDSVAAIELSRKKISESLEKEKHLNLLKSRFVSMASHEFKTPLTSIQLSADLIGRIGVELNHPTLKKYTETIKNAAKNLTNILNDFLSLELLETGKIEPIFSALDVVTFAEEITEDMQSLAKAEQQIIYQHTGIERTVTINPSLLKNSVINLISNAIKYSGPNSLIEFCTKITKSYLIITIKDNGIGIPKKDQVHLFEAFFRAHNIGNIPGTGLGLNIVSRYTALMNGKIKFLSEENKGTSFTLTFPIKHNEMK
ncbi:MAG: PAS domain-containing protein [Bacteroidetes bacterium]|nr:PAS domain-containing protein [Bacteroidota bacterium]MBU1374170.1 PAS domain-containing protein [Bacteroidota bacterium]MBU1484167.1 PAS domain-containing protein [Bacteroidota bacterium]MBU1761513.1 PAS domain-containing protein [Bacteroidota bacterium]MBU2047165.1 PAS domain-containing protein [Bacteroidota bacterium]